MLIIQDFKSCWHIINKNSRFLTLTKILSAALCVELFDASKFDGKLKLYDNIIKQESVTCSTLHWNKTNSVTPIIILSENLRASLWAFYASSSIFLYLIVAITLYLFFIRSTLLLSSNKSSKYYRWHKCIALCLKGKMGFKGHPCGSGPSCGGGHLGLILTSPYLPSKKIKV